MGINLHVNSDTELPHHSRRSRGVIMVVACNGSVQVMGEWAECDRQMSNFLSNLRRPLILPLMLCALIRHIVGLWSSHFRQQISTKKDYMKEDLSENWHMTNEKNTSTGFVTNNKLMLKTLFQMLQ